MSERHGVAAVTTAVLGTAVALAVLARHGEPLHPAGLLPGLALGALLVWSGRLQVHVRHRGTVEASDLFEVVLAVCAVAFPAPVLVPLALGAKAASQVWEGVEPRKAAFNTATAGATAAAMAVVLLAVPGASLLVAVALAHAAGWALNHLALLAVLTAAGVRRDVVSRPAVRRWAEQGVLTGSLGVLLALAWAQTALAVVLFAVPLLALHTAARSLSRATAERRRLAGTAAASRVLSAGSTADLPAYLEHLRAAYGAQAAVLQIDRGPLQAGAPLATPLLRWLDALPEVLPAEQPERFALSLPAPVEVLAVRLPDSPTAVLAVVEPGGERDSGSAETATVLAAARELAAFLAADRVRTAAEQEHQRLEVVVRSVADGILTVGSDDRLLSLNEAACTITGLAEDDLGRDVGALRLETPEGTPWRPPAGLRTEDARLLLRTPTGAVRHVDVSCSPAVLDGGQGAVLVVRDVTARVEQERARQQFVVGLGHELRTPLTPLLGWARTLMRRPDLLDGPQREHMVHALDTESARLARLVDNLLTAVDPTSLVSDRTETDLVELVHDRLRRARPQLGSRPVTVSSGGRTTVTTNVRAVGQVLDNLLSNVARYTPVGSAVRISVGVLGAAALVEVVDAGPGVPEGLREEIFGLFVRGEGEEANPGVGMGLAVSRSLARSLGGDLSCGPAERGEGAAFRLVLPVALAPRQSEPAVVTQLFAV